MCLQLLTFVLGTWIQMQVSDLSSYVLHESQFRYRLNFMLKETLGVLVH